VRKIGIRERESDRAKSLARERAKDLKRGRFAAAVAPRFTPSL
jgi:hypothetical protein